MFLKLTDTNGDRIYINMDKVESLIDKGELTRLYTSTDEFWEVRELPSQILAMLNHPIITLESHQVKEREV